MNVTSCVMCQASRPRGQCSRWLKQCVAITLTLDV